MLETIHQYWLGDNCGPDARIRRRFRDATIGCVLSLLTLGHAQALLLDGAMAGPGSANVAPQGMPEAMPVDQLIIKFRETVSGAMPNMAAASTARIAAQRAGVAIKSMRPMSGAQTHVLRLERPMDPASLQRLAQQMGAGDRSIEYVEPDRVVTAQQVPNDPLLSQQWHYIEPVGGINLAQTWELSSAYNVTVGVIDTGVLPHPELADRLLPGYDFIGHPFFYGDGDGRDADASDPGDWSDGTYCRARPSSWHGTHVAGTIAAATHNKVGVAGVAILARILPLRVLGRCGGLMSDVADAIVWGSGGTVPGLPPNRYPAKVLNLSLSGLGACSVTLQNAIKAARVRGTVVVVSAGNQAYDPAGISPAGCEGVISVAATNRAGRLASYSNHGPSVDVAAPGGDSADLVLSTLNAGLTVPGAYIYKGYAGTSMAAPHVAGVAAMMMFQNSSLTPDQVEEKIKLAATARGFPVPCPGCGAGILDAFLSVDAARGIWPPLQPAPGAVIVPETEPNDDPRVPQVLSTLPVRVVATSASVPDVDFYRVVVPVGRAMTAKVFPNRASDYDLEIRDESLKLLGRSGEGMSLIDTLRMSNKSSGPLTLLLRVYHFRGLTGPSGTYTLDVYLD